MEMGFGKVKMETPMSGNGKMIKLTDMEFIFSRMVIDMKVSFKIASK